MKSVENIDRPNDGCDKQEKTQNTHVTLILLERLAERGSTLVVHIALHVVTGSGFIAFQMGSKLKPASHK
ncbi:MAG: hypothetical protein WAK55_06940 [Xanthobacteraceae bacterium]